MTRHTQQAVMALARPGCVDYVRSQDVRPRRKVSAIVPAKVLSSAKSRLSPVLRPDARARLAAQMLGMLLDLLRSVTEIHEVIVVTADPDLAAIARSGGSVVCDDASGSLNEAIAAGAELAGRRGADRIIVLPADVPLTRPEDVGRLMASADQAIVPSLDRDGTNALLLDLPLRMAPAFGTDSFARHLDAAATLGIDLVPMEIGRMAFDVDNPDDLVRLAGEPTFEWLQAAALAGAPSRQAAQSTQDR